MAYLGGKNQRAEYLKNHDHEEAKTWEGAFEVVRESDKAYLLWDGAGKIATHAKWVPKSQVIAMNKTEKPDVVNVTMSEWIAKEKGFL